MCSASKIREELDEVARVAGLLERLGRQAHVFAQVLARQRSQPRELVAAGAVLHVDPPQHERQPCDAPLGEDQPEVRELLEHPLRSPGSPGAAGSGSTCRRGSRRRSGLGVAEPTQRWMDGERQSDLGTGLVDRMHEPSPIGHGKSRSRRPGPCGDAAERGGSPPRPPPGRSSTTVIEPRKRSSTGNHSSIVHSLVARGHAGATSRSCMHRDPDHAAAAEDA